VALFGGGLAIDDDLDEEALPLAVPGVLSAVAALAVGIPMWVMQGDVAELTAQYNQKLEEARALK